MSGGGFRGRSRSSVCERGVHDGERVGVRSFERVVLSIELENERENRPVRCGLRAGVCHWVLHTSRAKYNLPSVRRRPDDQRDDLLYHARGG